MGPATAVAAAVGPVVGADPGEAGDGGIEDLVPVFGAVALARYQHDGRRACPATFGQQLAAAADIDQAGHVARARLSPVTAAPSASLSPGDGCAVWATSLVVLHAVTVEANTHEAKIRLPRCDRAVGARGGARGVVSTSQRQRG